MVIVLFVLGILKYIMIVLLFLLLLAAIVAAVTLFAPLRYKIRVSFCSDIEVDIEAAWIFRIFKFRYSYNNSRSRYRFFIFGRERSKRKQRRQRKQRKQQEQTNIARRTEMKAIPASKPTADSTATDKENSAEPLGFLKRMRERARSFVGLIKKIIHNLTVIKNYPDKKAILDATYKLVRKLFYAVKPKKFRLKAEIGFDDPALTGRFIGALAFFAGMNGLDLEIAANFQKSVADGTADIGGRLVLGEFVWPLAEYVLTRPIRRIILPMLLNRESGVLGRRSRLGQSA